MPTKDANLVERITIDLPSQKITLIPLQSNQKATGDYFTFYIIDNSNNLGILKLIKPNEFRFTRFYHGGKVIEWHQTICVNYNRMNGYIFVNMVEWW